MKKTKSLCRRLYKRMVALVICAVLLAGMMPADLLELFSIPGGEVQAFPATNVYVNGVNLKTDADHKVSDSAGGTAEWDSSKSILKLTGFNYSDAGYSFATGKSAAIYADGDITISLRVNSSIVNTASGEGVQQAYGIYSTGSIVFEAPQTFGGSLSVRSTGTASVRSAGIYASAVGITEKVRTERGVGINEKYSGEKVRLIASGGPVSGENSTSIGIAASGDVSIPLGTVTATGGTASGTGALSAGISTGSEVKIFKKAKLTATGDTSVLYSYGIKATNVTVSGNETSVESTGGNTTANDSVTAGIYATNDVSIADGSVTAIGGKAEGTKATSAGIYTDNELNVLQNATVSATGGASDRFSYGVNTDTMFVQGGGTSVSAVGGSVKEKVYLTNYIATSAGIIAKTGYSQEAGTVKAYGGNAENASSGNDVRSIGIHTADLALRDGELDAKGGVVTNKASDRMMYSIGAYLNNPVNQNRGSMALTGGTLKATGGALVKATTSKGESYGIHRYGNTVENEAVISNASLTAAVDSGETESDSVADMKSYGMSGTFIIKGDSKVTAESGEKDRYYYNYGINGSLIVEGGEIDATAHGGNGEAFGIYAYDLIIKDGSNAEINVCAEQVTDAHNDGNLFFTYGVRIDKSLIMEKNCNSTLNIDVTGSENLKSQDYALFLFRGAVVDIAGGTVNALLKCGGAANGDSYGIFCDTTMGLSGGNVNVTVEGVAMRTSGIGAGPGLENMLQVTGGNLNVTCDMQGKTLAGASVTGIDLATTLTGGELTVDSDMYGINRSFDGSVVSIDGNYTDRSIYSGTELSDSHSIHAVSGTAPAPAVADINISQSYGRKRIEADLSGSLPEDAGEIRYVYVAGDFSVKNSIGEDSDKTNVSEIMVDPCTGAVFAVVRAQNASIGDVITIPVSIRSEGYAPIIRNVVVTLLDKYEMGLSYTQAGKIYDGAAAPAPEFEEPEEDGITLCTYSGVLHDGTAYGPTEDAPTEVGVYSVEFVYEGEDTRYIGGTADFGIMAADIGNSTVAFGEQYTYTGYAQDVKNMTVKYPGAGGELTLTADDYDITSGDTATDVGNTIIVLSGKGNYTGTKSATWSLSKKEPVISEFNTVSHAGGPYNGAPYVAGKPTPRPGISGMGEVTVYYSKEGSDVWSVEAPVKPGIYYVSYDIAEGQNYLSKSIPDGRLTIIKADHSDINLSVEVPAGVGAGYELPLPTLPEGAEYSILDVDDTTHILNSEALTIQDGGLHYTVLQTAAYGNACSIQLRVTGAVIYNDYSLNVNMFATGKESTAVTVTCGDQSITYGEAPFTLEAVPDVIGSGVEHFEWTSSDPLVATVAEVTGEVTILKTGTTTIYVRYWSDNKIGEGHMTLTVEPKGVTITGLSVSDKAYDGTTNAEITGVGAVIGKVGEDTVSFVMGNAVFTDKYVGAYKNVSFSGFYLCGADSGNYVLSGQPAGMVATITPKEVTADVSAVSRVYEEGNLNVDVVPGIVSGALIGEDVSVDVSNASAVMTSDTAGEGKAVTVAGVTLKGEDKNNYRLTGVAAGVTANIQKAVWAGGRLSEYEVPNTEKSISITSLVAPGGTPGGVSVTEGDDKLTGGAVVTDGVLSATFKPGTADGEKAVIEIPVTGAINYRDYKIVVTLTAMHNHVGDPVTAVAPTCTEDGNIAYYRCSVDGCGRLFADEACTIQIRPADTVAAAPGHDWSEWRVSLEAKESVSGTKERECSRCHDKEYKVISPTGVHTLTPHVARAASCTEAGNIAYYTCGDCGRVFSDAAGTNEITLADTVIAAKGHDWGEWITVKDSSETETGLKERVCKNDPTHKETDEIPVKEVKDPEKTEPEKTEPEKTEPEKPEPEIDEPEKPEPESHKHTLIHHARVEATEESEGNIEYWECSECKKLFADEAATKEITAADIVIAKLIPPTKTPVTSEPVKVTETIGDIPVTIETSVTYPKAVTWTGSKITKEQLAVLSENGEIARITISGLTEAISTMKPGTDVSKLYKISYSISKDKDVCDGKAYFTLKLTLKGNALKKSGIKGADKKALQQLIKKLNEQLKNTKYSFDIAPIRLKDAESISIKAKLKGGQLQINEDGSLKGLKSVKIKVKIDGVKKVKSYSFSAKKAVKEFGIKVKDAAAGTVDITATGTHFSGSRAEIKATK